MKKLLAFGFLLFLGTSILFAQSKDEQMFYFQYDPGMTEDQVAGQASIEPHYLGSEIALKWHMVREMYTTTVIQEDTQEKKTYMMKPILFLALNKLDKYYEKKIKEGNADSELVRKKLNHYLDVCLSVISQQTVFFEKELRASQSFEELDEVFSRAVFYPN